jgi:2-polyprenyl-3-methyl-5-hydroxy-6-metoxy-1,4-benzoquinol methylase
MNPIARYWKERARDWHASSYEKRSTEPSLVEWLATFSRAHIRHRHRSACRALFPYVTGRSVLEIGCGTGALTVELLQHGAARSIGIDVAGDVIQAAAARAREAGVADRARFVEGLAEDADQAWKPDLIVGLGILEYLQPSEVERLLTRMRAGDVLFAFDERRLTLLTMLHAVYRRLRRLPFYQKYREDEILALIGRAGYRTARVFRERGNSFVTTLPESGA